MDHKVIKPNIIYATIFQFFQLLVYVGIAVLSYKIITHFIGLDLIPFIFETLKSLEFESLKLIIEYVEDHVEGWFIASMTAAIIFIVNMVNNKFEVIGSKIIMKKGFIQIHTQEFLFDEIKRYEVEKDLGFLNSGTVHIMTMYGDRITLDFIVNIKKAQDYLDEIINMNNSIKVKSDKNK